MRTILLAASLIVAAATTAMAQDANPGTVVHAPRHHQHQYYNHAPGSSRDQHGGQEAGAPYTGR